MGLGSLFNLRTQVYFFYRVTDSMILLVLHPSPDPCSSYLRLSLSEYESMKVSYCLIIFLLIAQYQFETGQLVLPYE